MQHAIAVAGHWILAHLALCGASGIGLFLAGLLVKQLPAQAEKLELAGLQELLGQLKTPKQRAAAAAVLDAIDEAFPDGGDARFALAADSLIKLEPGLAVLRQQLIDLFSGLDAGLKRGLEQERDALKEQPKS